MAAPEDSGSGPVIRDNRRIDPSTGQPKRGKHAAPGGSAGTSGGGRSGGGSGGGQHRKGSAAAREAAANAKSEEAAAAAASSPAETAASSAEAEKLRTQLSERTADVQRLQAEYANYRKRVDRDRATVREIATAGVLNELLPILDAIGQAREHGELTGGFKSVADSLQASVTKLGLVSYGEAGDEFDPKIHEALTSIPTPDAKEETCVEIFQPGYRVGERVLRPARVAVSEPAAGSDGSSNASEHS